MSTLMRLLSSALFCAPLVSAEDWPQQGGPNRDSVVPATVSGALADSFPNQVIPVLWKTNVGLGTSPVVATGNRIFTVGVFKPGADSSQLGNPSSSPTCDEAFSHLKNPIKMSDIPGTPDWVATKYGINIDHLYQGDEYAQCLDKDTGTIIWATKLTSYGIAYVGNQTCSDLASPALADGKIVFHSPTGHLYCLNASDGTKCWEVNLFDHEMVEWGSKKVNGCGPLIVNGTVIVSYIGWTDANYQLEVIKKQPRSDWSNPPLVLSGFDLKTGQFKWICKPNKGGFRTMDARIGYAVIENNPTVLVPFGAGTYGVDPDTGLKRWEYDIADDKDPARHRAGLWAPYGSYAPVAWKNYIIDNVSNAHDDIDSRTWCIKIDNNTPKLVWETNQLVPATDCVKSNLIVRDGRLYGFDAHGQWDDPGLPSEQRWLKDPRAPKDQPGRNKRDANTGRFQCRDIETGKLIWSSDIIKYIDGHGVTQDVEWYPTQSLLCGDLFLAYSRAGLDIMRLHPDGPELIAKGPNDAYFVWNGMGFGGELVVVDGLLYVRKFCETSDGSTNAENLTCYDLRKKPHASP